MKKLYEQEKVILMSWRVPKTKEEKKHFGLTESDRRIAKVYIDITQPSNEMVDTFFHEIAHVFFSFHNHNVPEKSEEALARKIGRICAEVLK